MSETLPIEEQIRTKLDQVLDPELGVSIVALGLIYEILVTPEGVCKILMTLTTIGCPLFGQIQKEIEDKVMELEDIEEVEVDLSFDPPWNPEMMTLEAKVQLGLD
ncbi:MAG: iron-sulfur cluster assembly protein [Patescibacteria group bacterium]